MPVSRRISDIWRVMDIPVRGGYLTPSIWVQHIATSYVTTLASDYICLNILNSVENRSEQGFSEELLNGGCCPWWAPFSEPTINASIANVCVQVCPGVNTAMHHFPFCCLFLQPGEFVFL